MCNRSMYKRSVISFDEQKYSKINFEEIENFNPVTTFDGNFYACTSCHRKLIKGEIPCQSVSNKLQIFDLPDHLRDIRKLERILVAQRILFSKVRIMHKGEFPKLQGAICNVPIETPNVCKVLPRGSDIKILFCRSKLGDKRFLKL